MKTFVIHETDSGLFGTLLRLSNIFNMHKFC
jgi:hypothetical protein